MRSNISVEDFLATHQEHEIAYHEETSKRSLNEKLKKIRNTILLLLAYPCPLNGWRIKLHQWRGVHISQNAYIGMFVYIDNLYPDYVFIGDNVGLTTGVTVLAHFNPSQRFRRIFKPYVNPVVIKHGALVAVRSIIMPGVTIGELAIVSAGSVVSENVEDKTLVRGNPARFVGRIKI